MNETVYSYFRHQVKNNPDAIAVFDEKDSLTFRELDTLVNTIAAGFKTSELRLVGVVMNHGVEQIKDLS